MIFHKMTQDELLDNLKLINDETKLFVNTVLNNDNYYEDIQSIEDIPEFIMDRNEMMDLVDKMFQSPEYCIAFTKALWSSLWFIKNMGISPSEYIKMPIDMQIKTFSLIDGMKLRVRLKYCDGAKTSTKMIDIYDIMWDLICFPDQLLCSTLLINLHNGFVFEGE